MGSPEKGVPEMVHSGSERLFCSQYQMDTRKWQHMEKASMQQFQGLSRRSSRNSGLKQFRSKAAH